MPDQLAVDEHAVEAVLGSDHHLLEEDRGAVPRRVGAEPRLELRAAIDPERCACPGAGRRLGHQRIPERFRRSARLVRRAREPVPRARDAVGFEHRFHSCLVAKIAGDLGAHARDTQSIANLAQGNLQLLEHADQAVDAAEMLRHHARRIGDLLRIGAVPDPVMAGDLRSKVVSKLVLRVLADKPQADTGMRCGCGDEAHRRREQEGGDEDRVRHLTPASVRGPRRGWW